MVQPLWRKVWQFLNKLNIQIPYDSLYSQAFIYPKEMKVSVHTDMNVSISLICNS